MKLIIHAPDNLPAYQATYLVGKVIGEGFLSNNGTQYCFATRFNNGVSVYADKTKSGTHVFHVAFDGEPT
jgi:hypothetical protein